MSLRLSVILCVTCVVATTGCATVGETTAPEPSEPLDTAARVVEQLGLAPPPAEVERQLDVLGEVGIALREGIDTTTFAADTSTRRDWLAFVMEGEESALSADELDFLNWFMLLAEVGSTYPEVLSDRVLWLDLENDASYDALLDELDRVTERVIQPSEISVSGLGEFRDDGTPSVTVAFSSTVGPARWTVTALGDFVDPTAVVEFDRLLPSAGTDLRLWGVALPDDAGPAVQNIYLNTLVQSVLVIALTPAGKDQLEQRTPLRLVPIEDSLTDGFMVG